MRLTVTILGAELFSIAFDRGGDDQVCAGDSTSFPVGFTTSPPDQAWSPGVDR